MKHKSSSRFAAVILQIIAIAVAIFGQQTSERPTPSLEKLQLHVTHLASDKLEGRRTGTEGANRAATYIAKEFSRYGVQRGIGWDTQGMSILEADSPNRYLQKFPYVAGVELGSGNSLSIRYAAGSTLDASVVEDWMPLGFSSS